MKKLGVSSADIGGLMTKGEWARRKASYNRTGTGSPEVKNYASYADYVADFVQYHSENKKKG